MEKKQGFIIGIDEVGRGALAGPVVVAAVMIAANGAGLMANSKWRMAYGALRTLKDSKKLSAKQRESWCERFRDHPGITVAVARIYPRGIEKMNVSRAANVAASHAFKRLIAHRQSHVARTSIFLDGGLYLGNRIRPGAKKKKLYLEKISVGSRTDLRVSAFTMVKADEKIPAVAVASIIAKVHRDAYMRRLAGKYPEYGFEIHKGYGTKAHYAALRKHGPSPVHRLTFLEKKHRIRHNSPKP